MNGTLRIAKANATVTANSDLTKTYTGVAQSVSGFTASGLVNNEAATVLTGVTASGTGTNAGDYTSTASGTDGNYNLSFVNGTLRIAKANVEPTIVDIIPPPPPREDKLEATLMEGDGTDPPVEIFRCVWCFR